MDLSFGKLLKDSGISPLTPLIVLLNYESKFYKKKKIKINIHLGVYIKDKQNLLLMISSLTNFLKNWEPLYH